jgi:hypothetical protein
MPLRRVRINYPFILAPIEGEGDILREDQREERVLL